MSDTIRVHIGASVNHVRGLVQFAPPFKMDADATLRQYLDGRHAGTDEYWQFVGHDTIYKVGWGEKYVWFSYITLEEEHILRTPYDNTIGQMYNDLRQLQPTQTEQSDHWNTTCPHCGAPAYQGFMSVECSRRCG